MTHHLPENGWTRETYRGWFGRTARRRCPHSRLVGIYGDPVNHKGGWRLACLQCARYIDGPVMLARHRMDEQATRPGQGGA